MTKKRKITAWVVVCLLWELVVVGIHIFMCSLHKFPTLNHEFFGWLIPVFMTLPFIALLLGLASIDRKKIVRTFAKIFTAFGIVLYIACAFFPCAYPPLYPLMSDTKNVEDYLIFDIEFTWLYDNIVGVIPETIPENATNVVYNYHYELAWGGSIYTYWELPEDEYEAFKNETLQKDGTIKEDSQGITFSPSWNADVYFSVWMDLILNDENNSVTSNIRLSYAC